MATDASTDPALDANDEIAFMAKDTAAAAGAAPDPAGTVAGSRVEVKVSDSLDGGAGDDGGGRSFDRAIAGVADAGVVILDELGVRAVAQREQ